MSTTFSLCDAVITPAYLRTRWWADPAAIRKAARPETASRPVVRVASPLAVNVHPRRCSVPKHLSKSFLSGGGADDAEASPSRAAP